MDLNDTGNRIIAGIMVALLVIGAWYLGTTSKVPFGKQASATPTTTQEQKIAGMSSASDTADKTAASPVLVVGGSAVSVADQSAGDSVAVASATLPQTGWIAVRDEDGRILGAARFNAGTHTAVQVPLLRATVAGQHYQALLYVDDGDRAFDLHKDTLLSNADGTIAGTTFAAR